MPEHATLEAAVRERPILFSGSMVRAILDDRKTQTRRVAKLTPSAHVKEPGGHRRWHPGDPNATLACPYGQAGDRLWVRETWAAPHHWDPYPPREISGPVQYYYAATADLGGPRGLGGLITRPGIHMPRSASRLTLEVTEVRIRRLQDITEADCQAEGLESLEIHADAFRHTWDSINADRGHAWATNPWVWVVSFRRSETHG